MTPQKQRGGKTHTGLTFGSQRYLAGILVQIWAVYSIVHGQSSLRGRVCVLLSSWVPEILKSLPHWDISHMCVRRGRRIEAVHGSCLEECIQVRIHLSLTGWLGSSDFAAGRTETDGAPLSAIHTAAHNHTLAE